MSKFSNPHLVSNKILQKIKLFLDQKTKNLSPHFSYCLNLFKEGKVDKRLFMDRKYMKHLAP